MAAFQKTSIVYLATNRLNGKRYIGVTSRGLEARRRQHERAPNGTAVTCRYFHAAIKKYGAEAFEWLILSSFETFSEALAAEVRLISEVKPEYNLTAGGQGATGCVFTDERRARISKALLGKPKSDDHRSKCGDYWRGKKQPPEMVENRRKAMIGLPCKQEHREKIRKALKGRPRPPEVVAKMLATRAITFAYRRAGM